MRSIVNIYFCSELNKLEIKRISSRKIHFASSKFLRYFCNRTDLLPQISRLRIFKPYQSHQEREREREREILSYILSSIKRFIPYKSCSFRDPRADPSNGRVSFLPSFREQMHKSSLHAYRCKPISGDHRS